MRWDPITDEARRGCAQKIFRGGGGGSTIFNSGDIYILYNLHVYIYIYVY